MAYQCLTDEEFSCRLHEARSFLEGLKAEADARKKLCIATELATAQESVATALRQWTRSNVVLEPWRFLKPDGKIGICSWCEAAYGHQPSGQDSHGICQRHLAAMRSELEQQRRRAA